MRHAPVSRTAPPVSRTAPSPSPSPPCSRRLVATSPRRLPCCHPRNGTCCCRQRHHHHRQLRQRHCHPRNRHQHCQNGRPRLRHLNSPDRPPAIAAAMPPTPMPPSHGCPQPEGFVRHLVRFEMRWQFRSSGCEPSPSETKNGSQIRGSGVEFQPDEGNARNATSCTASHGRRRCAPLNRVGDPTDVLEAGCRALCLQNFSRIFKRTQ